MTQPSYQPLSPKDAIAYFRSKGLEPSFAWEDVWQQEHAKAFTVAKMTNIDLLEVTRAAMDRAIAEGRTVEQFKAELRPQLQAEGWWGRQLMGDPDTGEIRVVQLGSDRRLRTIFNTNARVSYQAGNWQRIQRNKVTLPWLVYWTKDDERVRPEHAAWHLVCLPVDDPWWDTHFPPCGWGCRCDTRSFSQRMLEDRGIKPTKTPPKFPLKPYVHPRTGEVMEIEQGIDPGWSYNVGKAPLRPITARPLPPPDGAPQLTHEQMTPAINAFLEDTGSKTGPRVMQDKDGMPHVVGRDLFRDPDGKVAVPRPDLIDRLPDVATTLKKPDQAEWIWASDPKVPTIYPPDPAVAISRIVKAEPIVGGIEAATTFKPVPRWLSETAKTERIETEGFGHQASTSFVRHVLDNHADAALEAARGQLAISAADFLTVPTIVASPDYMIFNTITARGLPAIMYVKNLGGRTAVFVEEVRSGRKKLAAHTMYMKTPARSDINDIVADLSPNVLNGGRNVPKIVDIKGRIKPMPAEPKMRLIRRYTKTLDGQRVTVDFSADTWTYDVQPASN